MKFNEKLIQLRKKEGLSQEELGYKLNVTRQTVSKWELGQTTPEMDKLIEISKLFNISVDELINESEPEAITNTNPVIEDQPIGNSNAPNFKNNKIVIIIVAILVVVIVAIAVKIFTTFTAFNMVNGQSEGFFGKVFGIINNSIDEISTESFNSSLELYNGSQSRNSVKNLLEKVITSNKKEDRKITVKYMETETQDKEQIKNLKNNLGDAYNFEVSFDYDEQGFINKITIETLMDSDSDVEEYVNDVLDLMINEISTQKETNMNF